MALKKKFKLINQTESIVIVRHDNSVYSISPKAEIVIVKGDNEKLTYPKNSIKIIELEEVKNNQEKTTPEKEKTDEKKMQEKKPRGRGRKKSSQNDSDVKIETSEEGN